MVLMSEDGRLWSDIEGMGGTMSGVDRGIVGCGGKNRKIIGKRRRYGKVGNVGVKVKKRRNVGVKGWRVGL